MAQPHDTFFNDLQLNTDTVHVNLTLADLDMNFNNRKESIPGQYSGVAYPVSGELEEYILGITLWGRGPVWDAITAKRTELITILRTQADQKVPILIRTPGQKLYEDFESVYVLIDSANLPTKGSNGANLLDIRLSCTVLGVPLADGGTITLNEIWEVESL